MPKRKTPLKKIFAKSRWILHCKWYMPGAHLDFEHFEHILYIQRLWPSCSLRGFWGRPFDWVFTDHLNRQVSFLCSLTLTPHPHPPHCIRLTRSLRRDGKGGISRIPGQKMTGRRRSHSWTCKWGGTVCGPLCQTSLPRREPPPSSPSTQHCLEGKEREKGLIFFFFFLALIWSASLPISTLLHLLFSIYTHMHTHPL